MRGHRCSLVVHAVVASRAAGAGDDEEDVFQGRLFLDVLDLGGREELLQFGEGAVGDDPSLVQDRDPVGEVFGLVQVLRGECPVRAMDSRTSAPCAADGYGPAATGRREPDSPSSVP
jgi:hypothetical protein